MPRPKSRGVKFNWDQTGMPATLVSRLGQRNEFAEFKSVLNDAQSHVMQAVDAEAMAKELVESGGREFVEMVRELTRELENTRKELEDANRRYENLTADLKRRGVRIGKPCKPRAKINEISKQEVHSSTPAASEWEEWNQKFQALLG